MHKPLEHPPVGTSLLVRVCLTVLSVVLLVCIALRLMGYDLRRDEQLYVPPIRLLDNHQLYLDFFYNHPPGSALYFHAIRQLTGSDHLLMTGRIGVLVAWVLFALAISLVSYAITRSGLVSWCIAVLTLANELFLSQTGMTATNNFLPLPFCFLGIGLFLLGVRDGRSKPVLIALAGFCLSLAVVFKLNAVAFIPPIAVASLLLPRLEPFGRRLWRVILPLLLGGLIGGLPILYHLVREPALFLAHVSGYHLGPHARYAQSAAAADEGVAATFGAKLMLANEIWLTGAIAVSIAACLALALTYRRDRAHLGRGRWLAPSDEAIVLVGVLALCLILSFVPTPAFPQYFAPPLVCLPIALALLYGALDPEARQNVQPAILAATIVVLIIAAPRLAQGLASIRHPERMTVLSTHNGGQRIAERLASAGVAGKVATLAPIYPLEGGLEVYPELATGPFAYRTADITSPQLAKYYRMVSPSGITALFDADPPAAILVGFEEALEAPMLAYAKAHGYIEVEDIGIKDRYGTGVLYIRPVAGG
jgi:hypothetical protein